MKLKQLRLENFRCFKSFECEFQPGINILVGNNGIGKTSILDAIAVGYGQFLSSIETGKDRGIHDDEIHRAKFYADPEADNISMERQFPVVVSCTSHTHPDFPSSWERKRGSLKGRTTQAKAIREIALSFQNAVQNGEKITLPLLAYYGTGRLYAKKKLTAQKADMLKTTSRLEGYRDCMDPDSSYMAFAHWFQNESITDFAQRMRIIEESGLTNAIVKGSTVRSRLLSAITNAVDTVLKPSGWGQIRYDGGPEGLVAMHPEHGYMPISMLSDGVRNMVGMIADIAYRCARLNRHLEDKAALETEGIVLIDEVDMHLHPSWQQLILQNLAEAFPKIQFIVTTHSPQVLTTVRKEQIIMLHQDGAMQPLGNTYGESSDYVLTHTFGVDTKPPLEYSSLLEKYLLLVQKGDGKNATAKKLRKSLEEKMGENHSDLLAADRIMKRLEFLNK